MADQTPENMRMAQEHAGDHEAGQLTKQTEGLDGDVTDKIAGPDWDPELVKEAQESMPGETLEGEVERGSSRNSGQ